MKRTNHKDKESQPLDHIHWEVERLPLDREFSCLVSTVPLHPSYGNTILYYLLLYCDYAYLQKATQRHACLGDDFNLLAWWRARHCNISLYAYSTLWLVGFFDEPLFPCFHVQH